MKILIVDDNKEVADMTGLLMRAYHHATEIVYDGSAALERAPIFLPELVLLDIGMPVLDGWQVAREMRKIPCLQKIKIYAVTGYGEADDVEKSFVSGMNYHFTKPLDIPYLWEIAAQHGLI